MPVGKICSRSVVVASPDDSIVEAARRMAEHGVGTLVVRDTEGHPVGMVTDRDVTVRSVAAGLDPEATLVSDLMTAPVEMVHESTPIEDALARMSRTGVRRLPVVDEEDRIVGILALDDVLELLAEEQETVGRLLRKSRPLRSI